MHKMFLEIPSQLETERLILRSYQKGDGSPLFSLLRSNVDHLKEHVDEVITIKSQEQAEIHVREWAADWVARTKFLMGIWEKASQILIGQIWIGPVNWDVPSFHIGWYLDKNYEGRGIATEAVKRSLTFLFEDLHAHKVQTRVRDTNVKSFKLAERCGFVKEGLLRDHAQVGGRWVGLLCYGMLKSEYETLQSKKELQ